MYIKTIVFIIFGIGALLNLIVILINGLKMPIRLIKSKEKEIKESLINDKTPLELFPHTLINNKTRLWFLGDIIHLKSSRRILSIGDIFMLIGVISYVICIIYW